MTAIKKDTKLWYNKAMLDNGLNSTMWAYEIVINAITQKPLMAVVRTRTTNRKLYDVLKGVQ